MLHANLPPKVMESQKGIETRMGLSEEEDMFASMWRMYKYIVEAKYLWQKTN